MPLYGHAMHMRIVLDCIRHRMPLPLLKTSSSPGRAVERWSAGQVRRWVERIQFCRPYGHVFEAHAITGQALLHLKCTDLSQHLLIPLRHSVRIAQAIQKIRGKNGFGVTETKSELKKLSAEDGSSDDE
jgi:hypothetical protein